jgi:hypothetical protein
VVRAWHVSGYSTPGVREKVGGWGTYATETRLYADPNQVPVFSGLQSALMHETFGCRLVLYRFWPSHHHPTPLG